ncbi:RICIN domain-containing protein [Streptosporangium sp. CA-135522]|uniref:RICIN domain-containing protein n=1 Tax=Streptosporangium sp. CA-135522 TaxID=3240072 RepID=UPI003D924157
MRIRSACAMVAVALSATVLGMGTAHATGPLSGTKIRDWKSGAVLGVSGNSVVGGAGLQYQTDTNDLAQKWAIDPVTKDTFMMRNLHSDMCVTLIGGGGEAIQQRPCDPRWEEQIFTMIDSAKPHRYRLRNVAQNLCLSPATTAVPIHAVLYACDTDPYQIHSFDVR